jgi:hypothetical protein
MTDQRRFPAPGRVDKIVAVLSSEDGGHEMALAASVQNKT